MSLINPNNLDHPIDSLLVLGRGIEQNGTLSKTGFDRVKVAVDIARKALPNIVIFSGGRSWVQVINGIFPSSEGGTMLSHAQQAMKNDVPTGVVFDAEKKSTSTVENMVLSKPLLNLSVNTPSLGILSDELHFSQGRIEYLAQLVFPNIEIVPYIIENPSSPTPSAIREENISAKITRLVMLGVTAGNEHAIMQRQRMLERGNTIAWRAIAFAAKRQKLTYFSP